MKTLLTMFVVLALSFTGTLSAESFKIGIMQDKAGAAKKYKPLISYFKSKGVDVELQGYKNYSDAAVKFAKGEVDAMFAGSGVAGSMIIKEVAYPVLRPVSKAGWSTYWAVVLAKKGSPTFSGDKSYFDGKSIICSYLASSGEFYARSILGTKTKLKKAGSHGIAIKALDKGAADIAIVKNRVWDSMKSKFPNLVQVGKDGGENPNGTLIVSNKSNKSMVAKIKSLLLAIDKDGSAEAKKVMSSLKITKYIETTKDDFKHTLPLLKKASVTKDFNFKY